jgi:K+-transporting ATPase C subunit
MLREIRPAIILLILLTLVTGLAYPVAMTAIAGVIFPKQAEGSLIEKGRQIFPWPPLGDLGAGPGRFQQDGARAL